MTIKEIAEIYPEGGYILIDGYDDAVIGIEPYANRLVYCKNKMIDILIKRDNMEYEEAYEFLDFNVWAAYMGEETPIYIHT
jgi:hypothetical protein